MGLDWMVWLMSWIDGGGIDGLSGWDGLTDWIGWFGLTGWPTGWFGRAGLDGLV